MNAAEFQRLLRTRSHGDIVRDHLFAGDVHAFASYPSAYDDLRSHLASRLSVKHDDIVVIGSAKTGFSLSPDTFGRPFGTRSDIDIAIVDSCLFDRIWHAVIAWHYPYKGRPLPRADNEWVRRRRRDLYWGWFHPSKIRFTGISRPESLEPLRHFCTDWFEAIQSLSLFPAFIRREVNARLYRTWTHAYFYHLNGLRLVERIGSPSGLGP